MLLQGLLLPAPDTSGLMRTGFIVAVTMLLWVVIGPRLRIPDGSGSLVAGRMNAGVTTGLLVVGEELRIIKI